MSNKFPENQRRIVVWFVIVVACMLSFVGLASKKATKISLKSLRVADLDKRGRLWIVHQDMIYTLDREGGIIDEFSKDELNIEGSIADIKMLSDTKIAIGSNETRQIHIFDTDIKEEQIIDPSDSESGKIKGAFHLLYDDVHKTLVVSDTSHHRILSFNLNGELIHQAGNSQKTPGIVHFPNGLTLAHQGQIFVADTNHHAIQRLNSELKLIQTWDLLPERSNRSFKWPVHVETDSKGFVYVLVVDGGLEHGEVLKLDHQGKRIATFSIPQKAIPTDIIVREYDLLVPDRIAARIYRFDLQGNRLEDFGLENFQELLIEAREQVSFYQQLSRVLLLIFIVGLIPFLFNYLRKRRQQEKESNVSIAKYIDEDEKALRKQMNKKLAYFSFLIFAPLISLLFITMIAIGFGFEAKIILFVIVVVVLLTSLLMIFLMLKEFTNPDKSYVFLKVVSRRHLKRFIPYCDRLFSEGERILVYTLIMFPLKSIWGSTAQKMGLMILTTDRLFIFSFDHLEGQLQRIQEISYAAINDVKYKPMFLNNLNLKKFNFQFNLKGLTEPVQLRMQDGLTAKQILNFLEENKLKTLSSGLYFQDRCKTCFKGFEQGSSCSQCRNQQTFSPLTAALLSAIVPGTGQIRNGQMQKALIYMLVFVLSGYLFGAQLIAYISGSAQIDTMDFIKSGVYLALVWIVAVIDAYVTAKKNQHKLWGVVRN